MTQLLDLTLSAPDMQEQILFAESVDGLEPTGERALRAVARAVSWEGQRRTLAVRDWAEDERAAFGSAG